MTVEPMPNAAEERAEGLAAQLQQTREALQRAQSLHAEQLQAIDDGDDFGEHVGIVRHRRAVYQGQAEIISLWEDALAATAPATAGEATGGAPNETEQT